MVKSKQVYTREEPLQFDKLPLGIWAFEKFFFNGAISSAKAKTCYQVFIFCLTFCFYAVYTLARRPFSVVKIVLCPPCSNESYNFSSLTNGSSDELEGWPPFNSTNGKTLLGSIDYSLILAYAIGLYISGYIADRTNLRYFLSLGMLGSGVAAMFLGAGYFLNVHHLAYFIVFQIFAGFMQATGWPGLLGVTAKWYGKKNRGKILGFWGSCSFVGSILGYVVPSFFVWSESVEDSPWGWSFMLPAFIIFTMAILAFFFLVTDPKHLGFLPAIQNDEILLHKNTEQKTDSTLSDCTLDPAPPLNKDCTLDPAPPLNKDCTLDPAPPLNKNCTLDPIRPLNKDCTLDPAPPLDKDCTLDPAPPPLNKDCTLDPDFPFKSKTKKIKTKNVGFIQALLIPGVIEFSLAFFFVKLVAYSFNFWLPFYVSVSYPDLSGRNAAWITTLFDVGGIIGSLLIGVISDKLRARAVMIVPMLVLGVPLLFILRAYGHVSLGLYCVLVFMLGVFINGPHIIIAGAVANDLGTHKSLQQNHNAKSIVSGIIDGTGSMGAATGPLLVGVISDKSNWNTVFYVLMGSCFLSAIFLLRLVVKELKKLISKCRIRRCNSGSYQLKGLVGVANKGSAHSAELKQVAACNRTFDRQSAEQELSIDHD